MASSPSHFNMFQPPPDDPSPDFEFHRGPLKRFHDEEATPLGFTEHRNKRLQTLPLRGSPNAARKWSPEDGQRQQEATITPPGSFSEDPATVRLQQEQQYGVTPTVVESGDMDMDMATDNDYPTHQINVGGHLAPGPQQPDQDSVVARRMPTPIQPSFAIQFRGNNWGGAAGNVMQSGEIHSMQEMEARRNADIHNRSVPRSLDHPATTVGNWSMAHNRSLPSPISESGGEDHGAHRDMGMTDGDHDHEHEHDHEHDHEYLDHDHSHLDAVTPTRSSAMQMHSSPVRGGCMDDDMSSSPSPRKGHSRSRHTIVQWTAQPGMKKSFSIGYRSDCEKCRNRVPGHFNHIIVS